MKAQPHKPANNPVHTAERAIFGHCSTCGRVLIILNSHEVWPWIECTCGWEGPTTALDFAHTRIVRR